MGEGGSAPGQTLQYLHFISDVVVLALELGQLGGKTVHLACEVGDVLPEDDVALEDFLDHLDRLDQPLCDEVRLLGDRLRHRLESFALLSDEGRVRHEVALGSIRHEDVNTSRCLRPVAPYMLVLLEGLVHRRGEPCALSHLLRSYCRIPSLKLELLSHSES